MAGRGRARDREVLRRRPHRGRLRSRALGLRARTGRAVTRARAVELFLVELPLVRPFRTSFGETAHKRCVIVQVETDEAEGWGECVADDHPDFSGEFNEGAWIAIRDFLVPLLFEAGDVDVAGVRPGPRGGGGDPP